MAGNHSFRVHYGIVLQCALTTYMRFTACLSSRAPFGQQVCKERGPINPYVCTNLYVNLRSCPIVAQAPYDTVKAASRHRVIKSKKDGLAGNRLEAVR